MRDLIVARIGFRFLRANRWCGMGYEADSLENMGSVSISIGLIVQDSFYLSVVISCDCLAIAFLDFSRREWRFLYSWKLDFLDFEPKVEH